MTRLFRTAPADVDAFVDSYASTLRAKQKHGHAPAGRDWSASASPPHLQTTLCGTYHKRSETRSPLCPPSEMIYPRFYDLPPLKVSVL